MDGREPAPGGAADMPDPEAATHQDATAFRRLFELHFDGLYRFAYRYVHSVEPAKDLVHEAFLLLWRQRTQVDLAGASAKSYLFTIVRYRALDHIRRRRVEQRWQRSYADPVMSGGEPALAPDPHHEFVAGETAAAIRQAVDTLAPRQREVLLLRWQGQASYDEIAETLGISPKTVAVHLGRAIQHLREMLAQAR
jgi:RNA polymerase sigma-70 factor (ECF subfamily)